jgi:hypothetical protein
MHNPDVFDDLDILRLSPEAVAAAQRPKVRKQSRRLRRVRGEFYLAPIAWADRAIAAVTSKEQLAISLRLYRRWLTRKQDESTIAASNAVLTGPGFSREAKRRALDKLAAAGLLEIVEQGRGRAPRIRIIDGGTCVT